MFLEIDTLTSDGKKMLGVINIENFIKFIIDGGSE